ncbi:nurim-like [Halichondria panicea]|uniref:nurim-like n=1 Tax=Halichondria panicea TaxID=6063 RepID=UPI00312B6562
MKNRKSVSPSLKRQRASKFTGLVLVIPGIILYIYILYIIFSILVYPGSFSPFMGRTLAIINEVTKETTHSILMDAGLLILFVAQHSLMTHRSVRTFFEGLGMPAIMRPLYVCCTCIVINLISYLWCSTPHNTLWESDSGVLHLALAIVHLACWISISCSVFTIDYLELLGIKQLYYSYSGFDNPWLYKSKEQQQLLSHSRHPIFLAPLIILWSVPVMTYDRFLVAMLLPLYVGWGSSIDSFDVSYVTEQFEVKKAQLLGNRKSN